MPGNGFSSCTLAGDLFSSSLQKPAHPPALHYLPGIWWRCGPSIL